MKQRRDFFHGVPQTNKQTNKQKKNFSNLLFSNKELLVPSTKPKKKAQLNLGCDGSYSIQSPPFQLSPPQETRNTCFVDGPEKQVTPFRVHFVNSKPTINKKLFKIGRRKNVCDNPIQPFFRLLTESKALCSFDRRTSFFDLN